jgi:DNA polymerase III sliding clamp (beta) subunit (PCNA family)
MTSGEVTVELALTSDQLAIRSGSCELIARTIDGEFPKYSAVIPDDTPHVAEVNAKQLMNRITD